MGSDILGYWKHNKKEDSFYLNEDDEKEVRRTAKEMLPDFKVTRIKKHR